MITQTVSRDRRSLLRSIMPEAVFFMATTSLVVTYWVATFVA